MKTTQPKYTETSSICTQRCEMPHCGGSVEYLQLSIVEPQGQKSVSEMYFLLQTLIVYFKCNEHLHLLDTIKKEQKLTNVRKTTIQQSYMRHVIIPVASLSDQDYLLLLEIRRHRSEFIHLVLNQKHSEPEPENSDIRRIMSLFDL